MTEGTQSGPTTSRSGSIDATSPATSDQPSNNTHTAIPKSVLQSTLSPSIKWPEGTIMCDLHTGNEKYPGGGDITWDPDEPDRGSIALKYKPEVAGLQLVYKAGSEVLDPVWSAFGVPDNDGIVDWYSLNQNKPFALYSKFDSYGVAYGHLHAELSRSRDQPRLTHADLVLEWPRRSPGDKSRRIFQGSLISIPIL